MSRRSRLRFSSTKCCSSATKISATKITSRFGRYFGGLEGHPVTTHVGGFPEILHIEAADGMKLSQAVLPIARPANKWHTDVTFRERPSTAGILRMRSLPPLGGDTIFADTAAIYADLPPDVKEKIATLDAEHDIIKSFGYRVSDEKREELQRDYPAQVHPVVRRHPETGEKHLFVKPSLHDAYPWPCRR